MTKAQKEVQQKIGEENPLGWTVIDEHFKAYKTHGFCAKNCKSRSETAEEFVMPTRKNKEWKPFDPRKYRAYETRQRWIRLPIDSKLTTDEIKVVWRFFRFDWAFEDDRSNVMHPTAEGNAATAQANVCAISKIEGVDCEPPPPENTVAGCPDDRTERP